MGRRRANTPLRVLMNGRIVGHLTKESTGAITFAYADEWREWQHALPLSLSLPVRSGAYTGGEVSAVFDNLLPDNQHIRSRVAERVGAKGTDAFNLLTSIGRDCVGALQFIPDDEPDDYDWTIKSSEISDDEIRDLLAGLKTTPLGMVEDGDFRISVAGAQEKTALLKLNGKWHMPAGNTPTTHILKPQIGEVPTSSGTIDLSDSVDNEHYCLTLLREFGLPVANTSIETFGDRRVLCVERFDRSWRADGRIIRLPQEDMCQATGTPSTLKYQSNGGPGTTSIMKLLTTSTNASQDMKNFFKSQLLFWLMGATDGHGKNFSIFLRPGGRYALTPFYDVLSAQPAYDAGQINRKAFKLAMSVGDRKRYRICDIAGRHFIQSVSKTHMGRKLIEESHAEIMDNIDTAPERAAQAMPGDFSPGVHESITAAFADRKHTLEIAFQ